MKLIGKTTQFFTTREEFEIAKELSINMDDSYFVASINDDVIYQRNEVTGFNNYYPIYTLSEILYKLPEWVDKKPYDGVPIRYFKDAPFYGFCIYTKNDKDNIRTKEDINARVECIDEYPIRAAMRLLFRCAENSALWYIKDISNK